MEYTKIELKRERVTWNHMPDSFLITPVHTEDIPVFEHCTKGSVGLEEDYYKSASFDKLFKLHGLEPVIIDV